MISGDGTAGDIFARFTIICPINTLDRCADQTISLWDLSDSTEVESEKWLTWGRR